MKLLIFLFFLHISTYAQEKKELPCLEIRKFQSKKNLFFITERIQGKITEQLLERGRYKFHIINADSKVGSINYNTERLTLGSKQAQKNLNQITKNSCEQILTGKVKKTPTNQPTVTTNQKKQEKYELKITYTKTKLGNLLFSKVIDISEKHIDFYAEEIARKIIDPYYKMDQPIENSDGSEKKKKSRKQRGTLGTKFRSWFTREKEKNRRDFEKEKRKIIPYKETPKKENNIDSKKEQVNFNTTNKAAQTTKKIIYPKYRLFKILRFHSQRINDISISSNNQILAIASQDKSVSLWSVKNWNRISSFSVNGRVTSLNFLKDSLLLILGFENGKIKIYNSKNRKLIKIFHIHNKMITSIGSSPQGKLFASSSADKSVRIWNINQEIKTFKGHNNWVYKVSFSKNGRFLASASTDRTIKIWNSQTGKTLQTLRGHSSAVNNLEWAVNRKNLISVGHRKIYFWNINTGRIIKKIQGHRSYIRALAMNNKKNIFSTGSQAEIKIWNFPSGRLLKTI